MTKRFLLTISYSTEDFKVAAVETIQGDTLIEICARLPLIVARIADFEKEKEKVIEDDDIPF